MSTVVVVHGTGVRGAGSHALVDLVRARISAVRPEVAVIGCHWGDAAGARLHAGGISVPDYDATRGLPAADMDGLDEVALWGLLYHDPLIELRVVAGALGNPGELAPHEVPPAERVAQRLRILIRDRDVLDRIEAAGLAATVPSAVTTILSAPAATSALDGLAGPDGVAGHADAIDLVVRAVVAEATVTSGPVPGDGSARDVLVRYVSLRLADELGWGSRSAGLAVGAVVAKLALRFGIARAVERRRGTLTDAAYPAAGDVALYLARGAPVRELIRSCVRSAEGPVTVLAHSLGGVASVDLLASTPLSQVALLVTVGSQAPVLYELGALPSLEFGAPLPEHFPNWVNVYDPRDLLAYIAAGVFPGRAEDVRVDSRQPFPWAHSAYFTNPALYTDLAARLP